MANHYQVEKEINGVKYVAQFGGVQLAAEALDQCYISENSSNISSVKMSEFLFKHIIVEPKGLSFDDFETVEEMNAVTSFARDVMQGKFRDQQAKPNKTKEKG